MFENKKLLSDMLKSPLDIQHKVLEELSDRVNGKYHIADSNSPFCNLLEFGSSIVANCMQEIDNVVVPGIYATKATTFRELSRSMSDFDYVDLFATPSSTQFIISTDLVTLNHEALDYNATYKKAIIPRDTVFTVGNYEFGIYYPIEIQINKINNDILVLNDVNTAHPLHSLTTNLLEHKTHTVNGLPMLSFSFPAYQFSKSYITEDVQKSIGFSKNYKLNHSFYACRIYTYYPATGMWKEMQQTTSDIIYDVGSPTAKISVEPDVNILNVSIPQVYFSSSLMGTKILVEIYTTHGLLDVDISNLSTGAYSISIPSSARDVTKYSNVFKKNPSTRLLPHATKIVGGSNAITFTEAKQRVVNTISHRTLLITPDDITKYFEDQSFKVTKHLDNISNRIYFCNGLLTDKEGSYIPVTNISTKITEEIIDSTADIVTNLGSTVTILPTAIYEFDRNTNSAHILSDIDKQILENYPKDMSVAELNTGNYTKSPFHVSVNLPPAKYATATSYNLFSTEVKSIQFKYDNEDIMSQMAGYAATILHDKNGSNGYFIRIVVKKSDDLMTISEDNFKVVAVVKDSLQTWAGRELEYIGDESGYAVYELRLVTDYQLIDDTINFTNLDMYGTNINHSVLLEAEWNIVFCINNTMVPSAKNDANIMMGIPDTITDKYIGMGRQIFTLHLGHSLQDTIYNICDATWSDQEYKKYEYVVYDTYPEDVFERDENGIYVTTIVDNTVSLNKLHSAGDIRIDPVTGEQIVLHDIGDIMYDDTNSPIVTNSRKYEYLINMMHMDARLYNSDDPVQNAFVTDIPSILETYFSTLTSARGKILEETRLYYRPIRTIGNAKFSVGDGVEVYKSLDMSFKLRLHVPQFVKNSIETQTLVTTSIGNIIEEYLSNKRISMTEVANIIRDRLTNYIDAVDVLGINGDSDLQTVMVVDDDAITSVTRILTILQDGTTTLRKDIDIEFVSTGRVLLT